MTAHRKLHYGVIALLFGLLFTRSAAAQVLDLRVEGDHLRISVNGTRLLAGDSLQRLRDGASVTYLVRVSALNGRAGAILATTEYRFVVSFDIFEEKFQVTRVTPSLRVASHLSIAAAEVACSESLELPLANITMPFWIRWEFEADTATSDDAGVNLGSLIDLFSRKDAKVPARGLRESGPYRLPDLPRVTPTRGARVP